MNLHMDGASLVGGSSGMLPFRLQSYFGRKATQCGMNGESASSGWDDWRNERSAILK